MATHLSGYVLAVRENGIDNIHFCIKNVSKHKKLKKRPLHFEIKMEDQLEAICSKLEKHNQENSDTESMKARQIAIESIQHHVTILKKHPVIYKKRWIPPVRNFCKVYRLGYMIMSFFFSIFILHTTVLLYFGLAPHLTMYTCSSLVTHNYAQFDFISTPSVIKGVACLGLTYTTIKRNQGVIIGIQDLQSGTITPQDAFDIFYKDSWNNAYELYDGTRDISDLQIYQDTKIIVDYVQWIVESVWHTFTHIASDSTRTFVKWLNRKTQIIVALRDAFIELPVIKQVREAVKAVEDTVEQHVVRPIRETFRHGVQCLIDGFSYFGKRLIQWKKTTEIAADSAKIDISQTIVAA